MKIKVVKDGFGFTPDGELRAALPLGMKTIYPGECKTIPTGLRMAVPEGYELQVRSKKSLASQGIMVANSPAAIPAHFRGEVSVTLYNNGEKPYAVHHGATIARVVLVPVIDVEFEVVEEL